MRYVAQPVPDVLETWCRECVGLARIVREVSTFARPRWYSRLVLCSNRRGRTTRAIPYVQTYSPIWITSAVQSESSGIRRTIEIFVNFKVPPSML